jgi:hypothetical protein
VAFLGTQRPTLSLAVFSALLKSYDAQRASNVVERLLADGFRGALTGSLATEAQLRAHGRPIDWLALNDLDLVVDSFNAIPASLADRFLLHHIHPHAPEGKTLLQLVDRERGLRVDLFRAFGTTLTRANVLDEQTGPLPVLAVEDLVARNTAHVCGRLRQGHAIDVKHVHAFTRLLGLGEPAQLADAWRDHRQEVPGTLEEATQQANQLLVRCPELLVYETYSAVVTVCDQCRDFGPFRRAAPDVIVSILGYW